MHNIEHRLRKLEAKRNPPEKPVVSGLATVAHRLPWARKQNLAAGERVVIDWYSHSNGVFWGRERISTDPADQGRRCKPGGYLVEVIQELHQNCPHREPEGSCFRCKGTTVAECDRNKFEAAPDDHSAL